MPEYEQPIHSRQLQSFSEILHHYPDFEDGRQKWFERVFFDNGDGEGLRSLASHGWRRGGPTWLRAAIWTLGFLGSPKARPVFRLPAAKRPRAANCEKRVSTYRPDESHSACIGYYADNATSSC